MDVYSLIILIMAMTGLIMVIGALIFVYLGRIKLDDKPAGGGDKPSGAFWLNFGKYLSFGTGIPGLALFLIGVTCMGAAVVADGQHENLKQQMAQMQAAETQQIAEARAQEDAKMQAAATLHLTGVIQAPADQDVTLQLCVGERPDVTSNNPFSEPIGLDSSNFLVLTLNSPGALPQTWTIVSPAAASQFNGFDRLIVLQDGVATIKTALQQVVDLAPVIAQAKLKAPPAPAPAPAGTAYLSMK